MVITCDITQTTRNKKKKLVEALNSDYKTEKTFDKTSY